MADDFSGVREQSASFLRGVPVVKTIPVMLKLYVLESCTHPQESWQDMMFEMRGVPCIKFLSS